MKKNPSLGDIYGDILRNVKVVKESAQENINKSKKNPKMPNNAFTDKNSLTKGGPESADGFYKALNDDYCGCDEEDNEEKYSKRYTRRYDRITELEKELEDPSISDEKKSKIRNTIKNLQKDLQREESEEDFIKESKKIAKNRLNTFMMKKSTFDKLFESVMGGDFGQDEEAQDVGALGLSDAPTDDEFGDDEFGGEEGDEITVTLNRDVARQLCDILQAAMGDEGEDMDFGDEGEDMDFGDEGEDMDFGDEDEDAEEDYQDNEEDNEEPTNAKDGKSALQGKNNKVNGRPQPKGGSTKVVGTTDKVGNDGDHGHAIHSGKQPNMGKQNKVSDLRQSEDFFR